MRQNRRFNPYDHNCDIYYQGVFLTVECPYVRWRAIPLDYQQSEFLNLNHKRLFLSAEFSMRDDNWKFYYKFMLRYIGSNEVTVFLTCPKLAPNSDVHLLPERKLCLFFPGEFSRYKPLVISRHVIPACYDWATNFEYYISHPRHRWLGNARPHGEHYFMQRAYKAISGREDIFD